MNILIIKYLSLFITYTYAYTPMVPFVYDTIKPNSYIIGTEVQGHSQALEAAGGAPSLPFEAAAEARRTAAVAEGDQARAYFASLQQEESFFCDLHTQGKNKPSKEVSQYNDKNDNKLWENFTDELYNYSQLLKETKKSGNLDNIDWNKMNREIVEELCEEMDDDDDMKDYMCSRDIKTYELTILKENDDDNHDEQIIIDEIIQKCNTENTPYTLIK